MTITERCVKKPVTTILVFLVMIALGIYCIFSLPLDMYPDMSLPYMIVYTNYPNAGPEEVEQSLTRTLESSLSGLSGLKKIQSQSSSGLSLITLQFNYGVDLDTAANEIRDKVDLVRGYLPSDASSPVTLKMDPSMMAIMKVALEGNRTPEELRSLAEDVIQPRLEQIDGVASAKVLGGREKSINVDIPRDRLEAYGLTISNVAQMIGAQNIQASGGVITSGDINYSIKTNGKYQSMEDLKNTVITYKVNSSGGIPKMVPVLLRDIADVYEGYKTESTLAYLDGNPCVMMNIQNQSGKNAVNTAKKIRATLEKLKTELPSDVRLIETANTTDAIEQTIWEVVKSVILGAVLAIVVLFIFLRSFKSTFIVGLAIPISVFISLMLMYFKGMTINMISMGGLLLGIGMLVDNSIVILENIYSYRQRDAKPTVAAILGSQEMISSITSSTLTSVCIFLPMILFKSKLGMIGQLFDNLAYTIIFSLLCSLLVAMCLVPVLSSLILQPKKTSVFEDCNTVRVSEQSNKSVSQETEVKISGDISDADFKHSSVLKIDKIEYDEHGKLYNTVNKAFENFFAAVENGYARGVRFVLRHRKGFIAGVIVLFFVSLAGIKFLGFTFMPSTVSNSVGIDFELPKGTKLQVTEDMVLEMAQIADRELNGVKYTSITVGGSSVMSSSSETNTASITWTLYPASEREKGWDNEASAKRKLRKYLNSFPGATLTFSSSGLSLGSSGTTIVIKSDDLAMCRAVSEEIVSVLKDKGKDFITEVTSDQEDGIPQAEIFVDRNRMYELGLNIYNVSSEINAAINGQTASRYTKNGSDIDVIVRLSEKDKTKLADLDQISVMNSQGMRIPLSSFAHYVQNEAPVSIRRENQTRVAKVSVQTVSGLSLDVVKSRITKLIDDNIPKDDGVTITYGGDYAEFMDALKGLLAIILMAAILVFVVMASQFESLSDPFIVILTIPFSFIGVILIYAIVGQQLNIITMMGLLVLVGTIVNNGIVLVDYINLLRKRDYELEEACVEAAKNRLRPILMSTLTTVISLMPMAFFPDEGSATMQPISLTVFGGMTFGSIMTLFLMPAIYFNVNKKRDKKKLKKVAKIEAKQKATLERLEVASRN